MDGSDMDRKCMDHHLKLIAEAEIAEKIDLSSSVLLWYDERLRERISLYFIVYISLILTVGYEHTHI